MGVTDEMYDSTPTNLSRSKKTNDLTPTILPHKSNTKRFLLQSTSM